MKRNVGYLQAGYPVLNIRSRIPAPGYPLPDTQSRIPDPESQIPYFYVAIPTFTAAFTPASTPLQPLFKYPFVEIAGVD